MGCEKEIGFKVLGWIKEFYHDLQALDKLAAIISLHYSCQQN